MSMPVDSSTTPPSPLTSQVFYRLFLAIDIDVWE